MIKVIFVLSGTMGLKTVMARIRLHDEQGDLQYVIRSLFSCQTELHIRHFFFFFYQNVSFFSYFSTKTCCGYSTEAPRWGASNEYPWPMFSWRNKKKIFSWYQLLSRNKMSHKGWRVVNPQHNKKKKTLSSGAIWRPTSFSSGNPENLYNHSETEQVPLRDKSARLAPRLYYWP